MHLAITTCHAMCFILVQIFLTSATNGELSGAHNISRRYSSQGATGRSKRSPFEEMPKTLRIRVKYVTGEEIDLEWTKKEEYLVNQYLPVITSSGYPFPTAMNDVGAVVLYQDLGKCSAVVYFEKFNTLFGVIGMNHYVADLPYLFDETGKYPEVVGEPYVKKREFSPVHNFLPILDSLPHELVNPVSSDSQGILQPPSKSSSSRKCKRKRKQRDIYQESNAILTSENVTIPSHTRIRRESSHLKRYYLEALVLVPEDVADIFKQHWGDHFIEWLVRYYIIYFNAVDMIYNKMQSASGRLLINIAKIVIEDKETAFDATGKHKLIDNTPQYFQSHHNEYPYDSFDHVFIFTSKQMIVNSVPVHGLTKFDVDLYEARKRGEFYEAVPKTLIGFEEHYISAVHEIARILRFEIDPENEGSGQRGQCNSIMQKGSSKCDKCLKWLRSSVLKLGNFLRNDRHRCFLMNSPRSVHPHRMSGTLRPHGECQCFGYDSYLRKLNGKPLDTISANKCSEPLQCIKVIEGIVHIEDSILPLDGTRCTSTAKKVCWNGECKELIP